MGIPEGRVDTSLHESVHVGDITEVRGALNQGHDPNLIGLYQWSAVHEAAHNGEVEILDLLLQFQGDPNKQDHLKGDTAVHYAAREGHRRCLEMLINAGGSCNVKNNERQNCLEVADPICLGILQEQRLRHVQATPSNECCYSSGDLLPSSLFVHSEVPEKFQTPLTAVVIHTDQYKYKWEKRIDEDCVRRIEEAKDLMHLTKDEARRQDLEDAGTDVHCLSDMSVSLSESDRDSIVSREEKAPALGYIHLSFEYNSRTSTVRIRVWAINDLLLPPQQTSMISTIYVKSYLMPDKKKDSKRKTDEVKVESSEAHFLHKRVKDKGSQHIFTPSTFKFSKPLEYSNVTSQMIDEKSVQIEVCLTQKYSKRSFLIGMFYIPMKEAIKKLVKDKYPLIPCMNHTIPKSMKVYSASELQIISSPKIFYSNPNIRSMSMSTLSDPSERAASDIDLKGELQGETTSVILSVLSDEEDCCVDLGTEGMTCTLSTSGHQMPQEQAELHSNVKVDPKICTTIIIDTKHDIEQKLSFSPKSTVVPVLEKKKKKMLSCKEGVSMNLQGHTPVPAEVVDWKYQNIKLSSKENCPSVAVTMAMHSESGSRPNTPMWDYYDLESCTEMSAASPAGNTVSHIPIETKMEIHRKGKSSFYGTKVKKAVDDAMSETLINYPGKAIPQIVVTAPVKEVHVDVHHTQSERNFFDTNYEMSVSKSMLSAPIPPKRKKKVKSIKNTDFTEMATYSPVSVSDQVKEKCPDLLMNWSQGCQPHSDMCVVDLTACEDTSSSSTSVTIDIDGSNDFTIPKQVFIDDMASSDSCGDLSDNFDQINPFLIPDNEQPNR